MTRKRHKGRKRKGNASGKSALPTSMGRKRVSSQAPETAPDTCIAADEAASERPEPIVHDFRKPEIRDTQPEWILSRPVFIVGFMGAGKTSVARKLARIAGVSSVDMDTYIERYSNMNIRDIFTEFGEAKFRAIEADVLNELAQGNPTLISCGGGVVVTEESRKLLAEDAFVVYLKVTAAEAAGRISNIASRPLFGDIQQAENIRLSRTALYEQVADISIDTAGRSSKSVAHEVFKRLVEEGILWQRK